MPGSIGSGGDRRSIEADRFPEDGRPIKPGDLSYREADIWEELMTQIPQEVLRKVDVWCLRGLVELIAAKEKIRTAIEMAPANMQLKRELRYTIDQISKMSPKYGLTPLDRRRLKFEPTEDDETTEWERG